MNLLLIHFVAALALTAVTTLVLGTFVYFKNPQGKVNRVFAAYSVSIAWWSFCQIWLAAGTDRTNALLWARIEQIGVFFIPTLFLHFVFSLLAKKDNRRALSLGYTLSVVFASFSLSPYMMADAVPKFFVNYFATPGKLYIWAVLFFVAYTAYGLRLLSEAYAHSSGVRRNQLKYLFWSSLLGYIGGCANFFLVFGINVPILNPFGTYTVPLYVFATTYAIVRYRLMDVNIALTRIVLFLLVYVPMLLVPFFIGNAMESTLMAMLGSNWWMLPMAVEALFAVGGLAAYKYVQQRAEKRLVAEQRRYQMVLLQASEGMTLIRNLDRLLGLIVHLLTMKVKVRHAAIYLWDEKSKHFLPKAARHWKIKDTPFFTEQDSLIECIRWIKGPLVTEELHLQARGGHTRLQPVVHTLRSLDAAVLVPNFMEAQNTMRPGRCLGFLILGDKLSGELYATDDLQVFQTLANQAALGIENARFYDELQRTQADLYQTKKLVDLGRMAGGMSHQVNNRFHAISVMAEIVGKALEGLGDPSTLDSAKLKEWWAKALDTYNKILANALRGGEIAKKLLKYGRPSSQEFKPIPITVQEIATIAHELSDGRIDFSQVDWIPAIPDGLPSVMGELYPLGDSISNLVTNSFDATQKKAELIQQNQMTCTPQDPNPYRGQIKLRVRTERDDGNKPWVVIEVQDNGVGMTEDELEGLFIPFFTTKATSEKGTGLGLYVIKTIVEKHGGTIGVASTYGVETAFTIRLPALREEEKSHA